MNLFNLRFFYTAATSGLAYLLTYLLVTQKPAQGEQGLVAFCLGVGVYLLLRLTYKQDNATDVLIARAYRLLIWSVPLLGLLIKIILVFTLAKDKPEFKDFFTLEDLSWASVFAIFLWLIINFVLLIYNIATFFWLILYYVGLPLAIGVCVLLVVAIVLLFKKLITMKNDKLIEFSLVRATVSALAPIAGFAAYIVTNTAAASVPAL